MASGYLHSEKRELRNGISLQMCVDRDSKAFRGCGCAAWEDVISALASVWVFTLAWPRIC